MHSKSIILWILTEEELLLDVEVSFYCLKVRLKVLLYQMLDN